MRHALILRNDGRIEHGAGIRRIVNRMFDRLADQPLHPLAVVFGYLLALIGDERLQQVGMAGNALLRQNPSVTVLAGFFSAELTA